MRSKKADETKEARREIERDIDLVQAPLARQKLGTVIKPAQAVTQITKKQLRERAMAARARAASNDDDDDDDNDDDDDGGLED